MRIAICEDEIGIAKLINEKIESVMQKFNKEYQISIYHSGHDLIDEYKQQFDVLFLDICLNDANGYDLAKKIRETDDKVIIIFLSSISDYVYDAYKINAFRYILKNKFNEEAEDLLASICANIKIKQSYITVKYKQGYKKILCDDIIYITSSLRKLQINTKSNTDIIYGKLSEYEKTLTPYKFIRTHQSYLVNTKYIKSFSSEALVLDNNVVIPVSKYYLNKVKEKVVEFIK